MSTNDSLVAELKAGIAKKHGVDPGKLQGSTIKELEQSGEFLANIGAAGTSNAPSENRYDKIRREAREKREKDEADAARRADGLRRLTGGGGN